MLQLYIMRHAKSSWALPGASDFDRELNDKGRSDLQKLEQILPEHNVFPELILCSSSVRTRQTLEGIEGAFTHNPQIEFVDELYSGGMDEYIDHIKSVETYKSVMTIGHNPMSGSLANALTGGGNRAAMQLIAARYPTSALSIIQFETENWSEITKHSGMIQECLVPSLF